MIKGRFRELLIHTGFISFLIWMLVVLAFPAGFSRYRVRHIAEKYSPGRTILFYDDLDSDGNSEGISFDLNDLKQTKIIVSRDDKIVDQYDLRYQPVDAIRSFTGDYNNDNCKELYVFTANRDSIFMNIIDPLKSGKIILKDRFIDFRRIAEKSIDKPQIKPVTLTGKKAVKFHDLFFSISTGYSLQPRNVYRYEIQKDSLIRSPESGAALGQCTLSDINNDGRPEVLLDVVATGNQDKEFPYTDHYSWLMVLDNNLNFLFPPVRFGKNPSRLQVLPLRLKAKTCLLLFYDYFGSDDISSGFFLYDIKGNKIKEKSIVEYERTVSGIFTNERSGKGTFFFMKNRNTDIVELDSSFTILNQTRIPSVSDGDPVAVIDADNDGKNEIIFHGLDKKSFVIVRNNFKNPVTWQYPGYEGLPYITQYLKAGSKPALYLQFEDHGSLIRYERNPLFSLKYPYYLILYMVIYLFVEALARIQTYRLKMKQETEKKMASLQMRAIKNQVDPHFTLNVLNAIGSLYANESDRAKADYIFGKYARLIRQTVITSEQITVTLGEELDFVTNYIEIERFRCGNCFAYSIEKDEDIDMHIKIPRMLIHTFVENSIKYGLRCTPEGGFLKIEFQSGPDGLDIIVQDNGPGLDSDMSAEKGTGKGLKILNELIELYSRLEKVKITFTLQNIIDSREKITGTKATIRIPRGN